MNKYEVIHTCEPNKEYDPQSLNPENRQFISYYIFNDTEKKILGVTGYDNFPYAISRDTKTADEIYGRSAMMSVLPTIQMLNEMKKTDIRASHKMIDPAILMRDDGSINTVDLRPGKAVIGGLDEQGNPAIMPWNPGARIDISDVKMAQEQNLIREAFLLDLFISNMESRDATATEIMTRSQEQARLLAPLTGREETESLAMLIEREINLLEESGELPEMPPELIEYEGDFKIEYTSPIANSQKADEALGASQTVQAAYEAANFDPSALDNIDIDEYLRIIGDANSSPAGLFRPEDDIIEIRKSREQKELATMAGETVPALARAELDATRAEKTERDM